MSRTFKFSGRIASDNLLHSTAEDAPDGVLIPPHYVDSSWGKVPQYATPVRDTNTGYDPSGDCDGYFMSYKYQANNNCYAYGCNIASNSFPQPGRASGAPNLFQKGNFSAEQVCENAVSDGLVYVGNTLEELHQHASQSSKGHYVALMFSPPEDNIGGDPKAQWPGDYHWARCDTLEPMSWSQKDGGDQVTNFDFAGQPITNPAVANWRVNQGPIQTSGPSDQRDYNEYVVSYAFYCFMFVPDTGVNIL